MEDFSSVSLLTKNYHVYPDFHGNRSPIANPELKGMVKNILYFRDILIQKLMSLSFLFY